MFDGIAVSINGTLRNGVEDEFDRASLDYSVLRRTFRIDRRNSGSLERSNSESICLVSLRAGPCTTDHPLNHRIEEAPFRGVNKYYRAKARSSREKPERIEGERVTPAPRHRPPGCPGSPARRQSQPSDEARSSRYPSSPISPRRLQASASDPCRRTSGPGAG